MMPNTIVGVAHRDLGEVVANLSEHRYDILDAMGLLISGI